MSLEGWLAVAANLAALAAFTAFCFLALVALTLAADRRARRGLSRAAARLGLAAVGPGSESESTAAATAFAGTVEGLTVRAALGWGSSPFAEAIPLSPGEGDVGTTVFVAFPSPLAFDLEITRGAAAPRGLRTDDEGFDRRCLVRTSDPSSAGELLTSAELREAVRRLLAPSVWQAWSARVVSGGVVVRTPHRREARLVEAIGAAVATARAIESARHRRS